MARPQIPNAGQYLEEISKGKNAYDRAVAALKAQRAQRQISSGLMDDWSVDPRAQYGAYQAMLQGQGMDLERASESTAQRGLFGGGLANQPESMMRYGQAVQSLGFKNQLQDWEREYAGGMAEAKRQQEMEALATMQQSYGTSVSEGDWGEPSWQGTVPQQSGSGSIVAGLPRPQNLTAEHRITAPLRASGILNPQPTTYRTYQSKPLTPQQKKAAAGSGGAWRAM